MRKIFLLSVLALVLLGSIFSQVKADPGFYGVEYILNTIFDSTNSAIKATISGAASLDSLTVTSAVTQNPQVTIENTNADDNNPFLYFYKNSVSPADADYLGNITFRGEDDASQLTDFANIVSRSLDVSNGAEAGSLIFQVMQAGTQRSYLILAAADGADTGEVVINEASQDIDFRVESDANANQLLVDGGANTVQMGTDTQYMIFSTYTLGGVGDVPMMAGVSTGSAVGDNVFILDSAMAIADIRDSGAVSLVFAADDAAEIGSIQYNLASATAVMNFNINQRDNTEDTGGIVYSTSSASANIPAAATVDIEVDIPAGAKIIGCSFRVDTALVGGETWDAAYIDGSTQALATAAAVAQNTKVNTMFDNNAATEITSAETDIQITKNAGGAFTAQGAITAVVYYQVLSSLDDV